MDQYLRHRINVGRAAVREQVAFFRRQFANVESEWKEDKSRVTFADFAISEKILTGLGKLFPEDDLCSEEGDPKIGPRALKARYAWVLDPVDGTNNFAIGMPFCGISLGLLRDGVPVYGYLYDYGRDKLIEGGPGLGLKDSEVSVPAMAQRPLDDNSIIGIGFPLREPYALRLHAFVDEYHIRSMGSGALTLAYVALGFLDGCVDFRSKSWDVAAGVAFMGAAGGRVQFMGEPLFPMKTFDVRQNSGPFYAGTEAFCNMCGKMLN